MKMKNPLVSSVRYLNCEETRETRKNH